MGTLATHRTLTQAGIPAHAPTILKVMRGAWPPARPGMGQDRPAAADDSDGWARTGSRAPRPQGSGGLLLDQLDLAPADPRREPRQHFLTQRAGQIEHCGVGRVGAPDQASVSSAGTTVSSQRTRPSGWIWRTRTKVMQLFSR
jgi:hypothetical protein